VEKRVESGAFLPRGRNPLLQVALSSQELQGPLALQLRKLISLCYINWVRKIGIFETECVKQGTFLQDTQGRKKWTLPQSGGYLLKS
jgi:hypothetical protein